MDSRYFVESLERGVRILEAFTAQRSTLSLAELVTVTGMDKASVYRLTYTFEQLGYLQRDPQSKRYALGWKLVSHGATVLHGTGIVEGMRPVVEELYGRCGETCDVAIRDGSDAVVAVMRESAHFLGVHYYVGTRLPLHCTADGKALICEMPPEDIRVLLGPEPYTSFTPKSSRDMRTVLVEMERVRLRGYAISDEESAVGVRGLAAPIRDANMQIVAALSIAVPSARISLGTLEAELVPLVVEVAAHGTRILSGLPLREVDGAAS